MTISPVILHLDMNSYFASVEQAANPALRGQPIVVGGGIKKVSVVAAASIEAKTLGIKTGMSTWEAQKLCPHLKVLAGDMSKYIYTSHEIMQLLNEYTNLVEPFSIDEAFFSLSSLPPATDLKKLHDQTHDSFCCQIQQEDEWQKAVSIAKEIKLRIHRRFNLTCTIGIAANKLLAKLAGELQKPDGLVVIRPEDFPHKVKTVAVSEFCGVGRKFTQYLGEMGIKTIGDLNLCPREKLVKRFGPASGEHLWQMGQGRGSTTVKPFHHTEAAKSMGHSYTLPQATNDLAEVKSYLLRLSEQVGRRLRRAKARGKVVQVALGLVSLNRARSLHHGFDFWSQQKKLADYLDDGYEIFLVAEKMLDKNLDQYFLTRAEGWDGRAPLPENIMIRFVSITVSDLIHHLDQISLFEREEKKKAVLRATDKINDRFGEFTLERAGIMQTVLQGKVGMTARNKTGTGWLR